METILIYLIKISGAGQLALALGSLAIPKVLAWKEKLEVLEPLVRQMFWTYAGYIFGINISFGIISLIASDELLNHSKLASFLSTLIAIYWIVRVFIQFFYFDRSSAPKGTIYILGEVGLVIGFIFLSMTYGLIAVYNLIGFQL
jgi:hypothetical protein